MSHGWVGANELLSSYADDLDDPRAIEEAERIRRAQERADAVVQSVLAQRHQHGAATANVVDELDDLDELVEDDLDEGYL